MIEDISIKLEDISKDNGGLRQAQNFLEEGSVVDRKDIADYILFSKYAGSYKDWLKEKEKEKELSWEAFVDRRQSIHLNRDIALPSLSNNKFLSYFNIGYVEFVRAIPLLV